VTRDDQDRFALESHRRAVAARDAGRFEDELMPISVARARERAAVVADDEGPRAETTLERLAQLEPAFVAGGTVTAGNSSSINDGAAALVIAGDSAAERLGRPPLARIVSVGVAGVDPALMGVGPVPATRLALRRAGLTVDDLDVVELNEAFASQSLACIRALGLDPALVNPNGGAIALGHPLGCSGARIVATLAWELRRRGGRYGLATMCVGVGQGVAMVIENQAANTR
jgi:acetyl-CoA acetyltransferase family protein